MARRKKNADKSRLASVPHAGHIKVSAAIKQVKNPRFMPDHPADRTNPLKISVAVNVKEGAITLLVSKGAIDEAQEKAADRFRQLWERMGGAGAGAIDYARTRVDGGRIAEPITVAQMQAGRDLKDALAELRTKHGEYACRLVGYICGEGYSIHDLTETRRQRDTMTDCLRMYLDALAEFWGFSMQRSVAERRLSKTS